MKTLSHATVELSGINLIEASAGTGKTYAITSLYLRLLVEKELRPEQILVVTYTDAATKELRTKIRSRIREGIDVIDGGINGQNSKDAFLLEFRDKCRDNDINKAHEILERALADFDTASIYTIHAFCLRALQDNVFESGSLYDTELITDQTELIQELLDDFWRIYFFTESAPLLGYALKHEASNIFRDLLKGLHAGAGVKVIPEFSVEEINAIEATCHSTAKDIWEMWRAEKDAIQELIKNDKGLSRSANAYRADLIEPLFAGMDDFVDGGNPFDLFEGFEKFAVSGILKNTKSKSTPPSHSFFERCETLLSGVQQRFLALQYELISFYRKNLPLRKHAGNIRFFDDLLNDLYDALVSKSGGDVLAGLLRGKYRAALIDEFQDTDPVQYSIFRTIYDGSDFPLFLIGDPKQAIYSFRGADIFAYMKAAREVGKDKRFTLTENWRSTPTLLKAFNTLFDQQWNPFIYDGIIYHDLTSGNPTSSVFATTGSAVGEGDIAPMQLWFMDSSDEKNGKFTVDEAGLFASHAVSDEIFRLLKDVNNGVSLVGKSRVTAGDIAVIVRTHRQAGIVLNALRAKGIPGVMRSDMSIFASREAEEVSILLSALCDSGNEPKIRAALVTDILGRTGNDIAILIDDEVAWTQCLREFHHYHHLWVERGFMVMIRELMAKELIRGRLLSAPDLSGERKLTNILHCFELLHQEEHERGLGTEGLAAWFSERLGVADEAEEYQIRLETDESAVKIVTVHISKGLEYPVVFCPFLWSKVNNKGNLVSFHNEIWEPVKDFGSSEYARNELTAQKELLAESLRLLYVALTRAKYRCYLLTGKTGADTSPVNYLFHASENTRYAENQATALVAEAASITADNMASQLHALAESSEGSIGFSLLERQAEKTSAVQAHITSAGESYTPFLRTFRGTIDTSWRVSSFTSFTRHENKLVELPDRDDPEGVSILPVTLQSEKSIFTFYRGAQAGIFMHWIFEQLDFASPTEENVCDLVAKGLERYSYDKEWLPHITAMVRNVLTSSLAGEKTSFTLGSLRPGSWITELEFFLPLKFVTSDLLEESLVRHGVRLGGFDLASHSEMLEFRPAKGMLMGFIDMVFEEGGRFYLLDWKSNHLGNSPQDYGSGSMNMAMAKHFYSLQYLLYTVALNRYLSLRVKNYRYSTHFGGVIYVFLRGVSLEHGEQHGFYRDFPPEKLIEELTNILIEQEAG